MNGYTDAWEYVRNCAPYNRIPSITTPTMFLNSLNDPFTGDLVIDYDVFKSNPNVVLATNKYAGHLGYHESVFSMKQWHRTPALDFLDSLREQ
jgi:predicted alpha/beta-fold hydrolase